MSLRGARETVESLRITLQKLEQSTEGTSDPSELAELKRILLARIADLEAVDALSAQSQGPTADEEQPNPAPADLPPLELIAAEEPAAEPVDTTPLDKKLD